MIVVTGREPSVLVGLADRLHSRELAARMLAGGENLFDVAWDHGASADGMSVAHFHKEVINESASTS